MTNALTTTITTNDYHVQLAQTFVQSFSSNVYWFFVGDNTNSHSTQVLNNDVSNTYLRPWELMIMGKALTNVNAILSIDNIPYVSNTLYTMYDDQDPNLYNENYYCVVNAGSYSHVFKCLDNNMGSYSTVQPNFAQIAGANVVSYQTADGYRWKYMYTVDSITVSNFATIDYFPYVPNTSVIQSAVPGSINDILIENAGQLYNNYTFGSFKNTDIKINGNPVTYNLSNSSIQTISGYYTGCLILLTGGTGIGQYANVIDYECNGNGNFITLDYAFPTPPQNGTTYEIYPSIQVLDAQQTINCIARAIINSYSSNSLATIEILNPGKNYTIATANVIANSVVGVTNSNFAVVRPIISPPGGHGANPAAELNARNATVWCQLSNSESNTILTTNYYQQIGLLKSPVFNSANIVFSSVTAFFSAGESIYCMSPVTIATNCAVNSACNIITGNNTFFKTQFSSGEYIILTDGGVNNQIVVVNTISSNTSMTITPNANFTSNVVYLQYPNISANMHCTSYNSETNILVSNVSGTFGTGSLLIGSQTGAVGNVSTVYRSNIAKSFNTFIQLNKYNITMTSGIFIQNETIIQTSNTGVATGLVHSVYSNNTLYVSELSNSFVVGGQIVGSQSGAKAIILNNSSPELNFGGGTIMYVENIDAVTRQPNQNEQFQLVFNF